jgi:hypothetical protein
MSKKTKALKEIAKAIEGLHNAQLLAISAMRQHYDLYQKQCAFYQEQVADADKLRSNAEKMRAIKAIYSPHITYPFAKFLVDNIILSNPNCRLAGEHETALEGKRLAWEAKQNGEA